MKKSNQKRNRKAFKFVLSMFVWTALTLNGIFTSMTVQAASKPTISQATTPGTLKVGGRWSCTGVVQSTVPLRSVSGYILNAAKNVVDSYTVSTTAKSYRLLNSKVDLNLDFNKLAAGTYYYCLQAANSAGTTTWTSNAFSVIEQSAARPVISGASTPPELTVGRSWTCNGNVSSSVPLQSVSIYVLDGSQNVYMSQTVQTTAKSYAIANSVLDRRLLINKLPAGTYYYRISATNSGGLATWTSNPFQVVESASKPVIFGASTPPALTVGRSWTCNGNVSSSVPLQSVSIYVLDGSQNVYMSQTVQTTAKSYAIANSVLDRRLLIDKLPAGTYYYRISATNIAGSAIWTSSLFEVRERDTAVVQDGGYNYVKDYQKYSGAASWYNQKNARYTATFQSYGCMAVSYGVFWSIVDGADYDPIKFWNGSCAVSNGYGKKPLVSGGSFRASAVYSKLMEGRPVVIYMNDGAGQQHYVVAVGMKKGVTSQTVAAGDIKVIDPYLGAVRNLLECPKKGGFYRAEHLKSIRY